MTVKNSWNIVYEGRYPVIDTDGLTYMVDAINLTTSDNETYYLDVIRKSDYASAYKSSPYNAASAHLEALKKQGTVLSSGSSTTYFDIGDEGKEEWIAIAFGVDSRGELSGSYQMISYTTQPLKAEEVDDWTLTYKGREVNRIPLYAAEDAEYAEEPEKSGNMIDNIITRLRNFFH